MLAPELPAAMRTLVDALAARAPAPAGGAAGVTALAMGIALGLKVVRFSEGSLRAEERELRQLLAEVEPMFEADCVAFAGVLAAWKIPKKEPERRAETLRAAWRHAAEVPARTARLAMKTQDVLAGLRGRTNPNLDGDLDAALTLVAAGGRVSADNACGNATHLEPEEARRVLEGVE